MNPNTPLPPVPPEPSPSSQPSPSLTLAPIPEPPTLEMKPEAETPDYIDNFSWEGLAIAPNTQEGTQEHSARGTAADDPFDIPLRQPQRIVIPDNYRDPQAGRIGILNILPNCENGYAPRLEFGEVFTASASVFIEGRLIAAADVVLRTPQGKVYTRTHMKVKNAGLDSFEAVLRAGKPSQVLPWESKFASTAKHLGIWTLEIEGWEDVFSEWLHDARIKIPLGDDVDNTFDEGIHILTAWKDSLDENDAKTLAKAIRHLRDEFLEPNVRLNKAISAKLLELHAAKPFRAGITVSKPVPLKVERPHSSMTAWYQFFPRSEGAFYNQATHKIVPGTFATAGQGLRRAKDQGFNVVYLPPIFPIGVTNRKGVDGTLVANPDDPGSPWAIGSSLGGHDTVDPQLGTMDDFTQFVETAHNLGLEVALDFALQCSPDHPWVKAHPQWFRHKPDGTIAFAENPPKKYQDIYPLHFENDEQGIEDEVIRVLELWIAAGVTAFRVDNPHTKPVHFWQSVIQTVNRRHPEILFLAEAFTRPAMMRALSYAGFTQSHCYFPWRNTKEELEEYLVETNGVESSEGFYQHSTFWPTTPDILTDFIRDNGIAGHAIRAVLAALGSPSWGIYSGYELIENQQRSNAEEQAHNEKYEIKVRDWQRAEEFGISTLLTRLNAIRNEHECVRSFHTLTIQETESDSILAFSRYLPAEVSLDGKPDALIVVVNLDGHDAHQTMVNLDLSTLGLDEKPEGDEHFTVHDELTGKDFEWGRSNYVSLAPWGDVAHILRVKY